MAHWHGISRRKPTGGRLKRPNRYRGKRRTEIASEKQFASIGEPVRKVYRKRSGLQTVRILTDNVVNVNDPKKGVTKKANMVTVVESPADVNYVRRNIITKGAVVDTDAGKVRLTSRPGKDGVLNGVLIDE
uniref:Small ribosomal subunit protein eS8 n=2 Tax=environmental samples TaxID=68359 RepID=A0A075HPL4_9EURY|nr:ribosomal protein s8e (RP-S8e, RPS8) [uncultured marine group II/III euryarchaeote KM3_192_B10]AIF16362.1 ribosomal protein S8e (RP-S8e, RPS8) [uncultured marine group II/III euryarchaeote KM3_74_A11]MBC8518239.1 30S ribosomal protein S8e [Euryarchaeota archaeon]